MSVIYIVLPLALLLAAIAVAAFVWAVRGGQFDDLDTPAWRVVADSDHDDSDRERGTTSSADVPPARDD
ncbi:MAG: cbb3-type cytochrome oxidase assembly protein CcoS [Phycisphaerales bacterium]|nr:cbb3-type cytochrome oxidase assembly protein CcoS [Phycisphaerales bacterium]